MRSGSFGAVLSSLLILATGPGFARGADQRPDDSPTTTYQFNPAGNLETIGDRHGSQITHEYDSAGRLMKTTYPDGTWVKYRYDGRGRLQGIQSSDGDLIRYDRDDLRRRMTVTYPDHRAFDFWHDGEGRVVRIDYPDGTWARFKHDRYGRVERIAHQTEATEYRYDNMGDLDQIVTSSGSAVRFHRDGDHLGRITYPSGATQPAWRLSYRWTPQGRIEGLTDPLGSFRCTYDDTGRLKVVSAPLGVKAFINWEQGRPVSISTPLGFARLDALGQFSSLTSIAGVRTLAVHDRATGLHAVVDPAFGLARVQHDPSGVSSRATQPDGLTRVFEWDPLGRVRSMTTGGDRYVYHREPAGQLTHVTGSTGIVSPLPTPQYHVDMHRRLMEIRAPLPHVSTAELLPLAADRFWLMVSALVEQGGRLPMPSQADIDRRDQYWKSGAYWSSDPYYQALAGDLPDLTPEKVTKVQFLTMALVAVKFARFYEAIGLAPQGVLPAVIVHAGLYSADRVLARELTSIDESFSRLGRIDPSSSPLVPIAKAYRAVQTVLRSIAEHTWLQPFARHAEMGRTSVFSGARQGLPVQVFITLERPSITTTGYRLQFDGHGIAADVIRHLGKEALKSTAEQLVDRLVLRDVASKTTPSALLEFQERFPEGLVVRFDTRGGVVITRATVGSEDAVRRAPRLDRVREELIDRCDPLALVCEGGPIPGARDGQD